MNKRCRCIKIAGYEVLSQWKRFLFYFIISVILMSAIISAASLAAALPDEMNGYVLDEGLCNMALGDVNEADFEKIEALPLEMNSYGLDLDCTAIGLEENTYCEVDGMEIYLYGSAERMPCNGKHFYLNDMNERLLSGKRFENSDNVRSVVWVSDVVCEILKVQCGDIVSLCIDSETVECEIAGTYRFHPGSYAFYTTTEVYKKLTGSAIENVTIYIKVPEIEDYFYIWNQLNGMYFQITSDKEQMNSVMMIVYAIYGICLFLLLLELCIMVALTKMYFHQRSEFFMICRAIGMRKRYIVQIVAMVMQVILTASFGCAMVIAPLLNHYIVRCVAELFEEIEIVTHIWTKETFLLYIVTSAIMWISCVINQFYFGSGGIAALIHKNDK